MPHIQRCCGIVNETEVNVFLEFPCFLNDPENVGNLIPDSSAFSKPSLNIWEFSVHVMLKYSLEDFKHYLASIWNECNCAVVWTCFTLPFFGTEMKTDLFQSHGHCRVFQICLHTECSTLTALLQKSFIFLYINNELSENKMNKIIPLKVATQINT